MQLSNQKIFGNESQTSRTGSLLTNTLRYTPVTPLGDISGNNTQLGLYDNYVRPEYDPIKIIYDVYDRTDRQRIRANTSLTWKPIDGLTLRSEYGMSKEYSSQYYFYRRFCKNNCGVEGGNATITKNYSTRYRFVNTANYSFKNLLGGRPSIGYPFRSGDKWY